jgi:hypothetical protein
MRITQYRTSLNVPETTHRRVPLNGLCSESSSKVAKELTIFHSSEIPLAVGRSVFRTILPSFFTNLHTNNCATSLQGHQVLPGRPVLLETCRIYLSCSAGHRAANLIMQGVWRELWRAGSRLPTSDKSSEANVLGVNRHVHTLPKQLFHFLVRDAGFPIFRFEISVHLNRPGLEPWKIEGQCGRGLSEAGIKGLERSSRIFYLYRTNGGSGCHKLSSRKHEPHDVPQGGVLSFARACFARH